MTIVTYVHRTKRTRKREGQAAALNLPAIVTIRSGRDRWSVADPAPAYTDRKNPTSVDRPPESAIVAAKNPHRRGRFGDVPDMTPEERRGDAADALWRELVRRVREE